MCPSRGPSSCELIELARLQQLIRLQCVYARQYGCGCKLYFCRTCEKIADSLASSIEQHGTTRTYAALLGELGIVEENGIQADSPQVKDSLFKNPAVGALLYNAGNIGKYSQTLTADHGRRLISQRSTGRPRTIRSCSKALSTVHIRSS